MSEQEQQARSGKFTNFNISVKEQERAKLEAQCKAWIEKKGGSQRDWILQLAAREEACRPQEELAIKLREQLGPLADLYQVRRQQDDRFLAQIADVITQAQNAATAKVQAQIDALEKDKALAHKSLDEATVKIKDMDASMKLAKEEEAKRLIEQQKQFESEKSALLKQLEEQQAITSNTSKAMNEAKEALLEVKEHLLIANQELSKSQTEAKEAAIAHDQAIAQMKQEAATIALTHEKELAKLNQELTAAKHAQETAENALEKLEADKSAVIEEIKALKEQAGTLQATISILKEDAAASNAENKSLKTQIADLKEHQMALMDVVKAVKKTQEPILRPMTEEEAIIASKAVDKRQQQNGQH